MVVSINDMCVCLCVLRVCVCVRAYAYMMFCALGLVAKYLIYADVRTFR